jgi:hypothetical protein
MGNWTAAGGSQSGHAAPKCQATSPAAFPGAAHRHPDTAEVPGSSPGTPGQTTAVQPSNDQPVGPRTREAAKALVSRKDSLHHRPGQAVNVPARVELGQPGTVLAHSHDGRPERRLARIDANP